MMNDETGEVRIFDEDPERVVSVTVGELQKPWTIQSDDWLRNPTVHERTCNNIAPHYLRFLCSECHYVIYHDDANETGEPKEDGIGFCPHCGARVIGGDEVRRDRRKESVGQARG